MQYFDLHNISSQRDAMFWVLVVSEFVVAVSFLYFSYFIFKYLRKFQTSLRDLAATVLSAFLAGVGVVSFMTIFKNWEHSHPFFAVVKVSLATSSIYIVFTLRSAIPLWLSQALPIDTKKIKNQLQNEMSRRQKIEKQLQTTTQALEDARRESVEGSKDRYLALLESTTDIYWDLNVELEMTSPQKIWCQQTGQTIAQAKGRGWLDAIHEEDRQIFSSNSREVLQQKVYQIRIFSRARNSFHMFQIQSTLVTNEESHNNLVIFTGWNIEEKVRLNEQFQNLFAYSPAGLLVMNESGQIMLTNSKLEKLFGFSSSEMVGKNIETLIASDMHDDFKMFLTAFVKSTGPGQAAQENIWQGKNRDGAIFPFEISLTPFQDAAGDQVLAAISDQSEVFQLMKKTRAANEELTSFAYTVSHDLRAPLRGISHLAEWIVEDCHAQLPEESKKHLDMLKIRVGNLGSMVDALLSYATLGKIEGNLKSVNLSEQINRIASDYNEVDLVLGPGSLPEHLITYPAPLEVVLRNLLSNAVKYRRNNRVTVKINWRIQDSKFIRFVCEDNGKGIEPSKIPRIFDMFFTGDGRDNDQSTGLGLALVRRIVHSFDGQIHVLKSKLNEGTAFVFTWSTGDFKEQFPYVDEP